MLCVAISSRELDHTHLDRKAIKRAPLVAAASAAAAAAAAVAVAVLPPAGRTHTMIEVICNDRLGKKIPVKRTGRRVGYLKKLLAAQIGTRSEKLRIQKYTVYKDYISLEDYEIHDGMGPSCTTIERRAAGRCLVCAWTSDACRASLAAAGWRAVVWSRVWRGATSRPGAESGLLSKTALSDR